MADVNSSRIISDSFQAEETIPAFAAVSTTPTGTIANTNWPDPISVSNFLGIALTGNYAGLPVEVCLFGIVENYAWSFTPLRPVYLYYTGTLTQSNPGEALKKIGKAITPTKLFVAPNDFLMLSQ
jgi:hypothetical protein